jgi:hypothetical protein
MPAADEHVPSRYLGSRLKTRRVCRGCNERAGREIDDRMANYLMVQVPKALADVRSIKHQAKEPHAESEGGICTFAGTSFHGRGGFRTCDLSRVKRALSH